MSLFYYNNIFKKISGAKAGESTERKIMTMKTTRRGFVQAGTLASLAGSAIPAVHAGETHLIKVGLVGCGGRGRGAAMNALAADKNCKLVALGDAFAERARASIDGFKNRYGDRVDVPENRIFSGLDCYRGVLQECDLVLLCEPPHFRYRSLRAAVEAGKHIFCEKPAASDAPGVRHVIESAKMARDKGLNAISGLCWRYENNVRGIIERIRDGLIGEVCTAQVNYMTGRVWNRPRLENDTEMMFQVRNWYNFSWLSGDFNVEQHVHSIDKGTWGLGDIFPQTAYGLGARMGRTEQPAYGDIYDSMGTVFEYANGRKMYSFCRQQNGCWNQANEFFIGSKGYAEVIRSGPNSKIYDLDGKVLYEHQREKCNMHQREIEVLFEAIRSGGKTTLNNIEQLALVTLVAIMGRLACYSGKLVTWDEVLNSPGMAPSGYTWNDTPPKMPDDKGRYRIPVPGLGEVYHTVTR